MQLCNCATAWWCCAIVCAARVSPLPLLPTGSHKVGQVAWVVRERKWEDGLIGNKQAMPALAQRCLQGAVVCARRPQRFDSSEGKCGPHGAAAAAAATCPFLGPPMGAGAQLRQRFPHQSLPQPHLLQVRLAPAHRCGLQP